MGIPLFFVMEISARWTSDWKEEPDGAPTNW